MSSKWEEKWFEDIDYLKENLIKRHKNLFFNTSREEFEEKINYLKSIINNLDYDDMKVELSRIVASVKDAHTSIIFPVKKYLPFKFYWFQDGIYIIKVTEKYKSVLYKKVISIEGVFVSEVIDELKEIISYENDFLFKEQSMRYMQAADILYGLLLIDSVDRVKIQLEDCEINVETVSLDELIYNEEYKLPMYAKNEFKNFWYEHIENTKEIYIKYNSCREDGIIELSEKINEVIEYINKNSIEKLIIDLSDNLGGDSRLIRPLIDFIKKSTCINSKENLSVIIGRGTFSSALLNAYEFKNETNAKLIGEPSGGKPNCYGEILKFQLPNSKFVVTYSTRYYKLIEDDSVIALYPEEIFYRKIEDYTK
jgi:Peptidase family S41